MSTACGLAPVQACYLRHTQDDNAAREHEVYKSVSYPYDYPALPSIDVLRTTSCIHYSTLGCYR